MYGMDNRRRKITFCKQPFIRRYEGRVKDLYWGGRLFPPPPPDP